MGRIDERDLFKSYMEDFNTGGAAAAGSRVMRWWRAFVCGIRPVLPLSRVAAPVLSKEPVCSCVPCSTPAACAHSHLALPSSQQQSHTAQPANLTVPSLPHAAGTMPHKKYYDLAAYERERAYKAAQKAAKSSRGHQQRTARDDEEEVRRERAAQRAKEVSLTFALAIARSWLLEARVEVARCKRRAGARQGTPHAWLARMFWLRTRESLLHGTMLCCAGSAAWLLLPAVNEIASGCACLCGSSVPQYVEALHGMLPNDMAVRYQRTEMCHCLCLVQAQERMAQAYDDIRSGKAEDMRQQEILRSQMALAYKTGDTATALKLQNLLLPDHMRKEDDKKLPTAK